MTRCDSGNSTRPLFGVTLAQNRFEKRGAACLFPSGRLGHGMEPSPRSGIYTPASRALRFREACLRNASNNCVASSLSKVYSVEPRM
jgi:hypothetical protein